MIRIKDLGVAPIGGNGLVAREAVNGFVSAREEERRCEDHYVFGKVIGTGAFSVVKECTSKSTGQRFAVKIIRHSDLRPCDLKVLEREISFSSTLKHPGIVRLVDVFIEFGNTYLLFQLHESGDLFDKISCEGCLDEAAAAFMLGGLLDTLCYIHQAGVIHRDVKLENILLSTDEEGRLIGHLGDLGFAKFVNQEGSLDEACGTPEYVAPELLQGLPYDCKADIFSLGVVSYTMCGGYLPFYSTNKEILFRSIIRGDFHFHSQFWSHVSCDAKDFIACALQTNPAQRPSAEELRLHPWIQRYRHSLYPTPSTSRSVSGSSTILTEDDLDTDISRSRTPEKVQRAIGIIRRYMIAAALRRRNAVKQIT